MKRNTLTALALLVVILMMGACGNNAWDELPTSISRFVTWYFPEGEIESYSTSSQGSTVQIRNGATLKFNNEYEWTEINGNGVPLPDMFLSNQLPEPLYTYIEEMEQQRDVMLLKRTPQVITVEFRDSEIDYDRSTQTISYPSARK